MDPKRDQNETTNHSKNKLLRLGQPGKFDFSILLATWLISVPFLTPLDFPGGPKIDHFWKTSRKNLKKGGPKNSFQKTWFVDWLFIEFRMDFGFIFDVFFDTFTITQTPDFLDFWAFWKEVFFRRFLGSEKVGPKSGKKKFQKEIEPSKIARPGGMRGASGEVRRGWRPLRVRQILIKNSNLRTFSLEFQDLAKTLSLEF